MTSSSPPKGSSRLPRHPNLLGMVVVPVATATSDQHQEGITLQRPRGRSGLGQRLYDLIGASPYIRVVLDSYGTQVWHLLDGRRTVAEVAAALRSAAGEGVEPLHPRLATFLMLLEDRGMVRIVAAAAPP